MGYNGSNRRGAKASMWRKSSSRIGSNILFGKRGVVTGLFDIGSSIAKDTISEVSQNNKKRPQKAIQNDVSINILVVILLTVVLILMIIAIIHVPLLAIIIGVLLLGAFLRK